MQHCAFSDSGQYGAQGDPWVPGTPPNRLQPSSTPPHPFCPPLTAASCEASFWLPPCTQAATSRPAVVESGRTLASAMARSTASARSQSPCPASSCAVVQGWVGQTCVKLRTK